MNRKIQDTSANQEQRDNGAFAVRRSYRTTVIAALICLLLGFVVWIVVMGFDDSDHVKLLVAEPQEGYTYTLSTELVEVRGTLAVLRNTREIGVRLLEDKDGDSIYRLSDGELALEIPEGVRLPGDHIELTVKVSAN